MSFFDDGDDEAPPTATRVTRSPRPRSPGAGARAGMPDQQTLLVRRAVAGGVALVILVLIILGISGCLRSQKRDALKSYNRNVSSLATESVQQVAQPLYKALAGATGKSALDVEFNIDQLKQTAVQEASNARSLSVPSEMAGAQRDFLLTMDFRASAVGAIAAQIRNALAATGSGDAVNQIAGQMEVLLASDVVYSQRVAPLTQQALNSNGVPDQTTSPSRFITDIGWLDPATVRSRITGQASTTAAATPGPHGHSLTSVSIGSTTLAPSPAVNRIPGGSNPTFTVALANGGNSPETNVKVDVSVVAGGKTITETKTIDRTTPGTPATVDIPVPGVPLSTAARVTVNIEPVPGEKNVANNKGTFTAVFSP